MQPFVTGAVECWIWPVGFGTPQPLGYSERGFRFEESPSYTPYVTDFGGTVPYDEILAGVTGRVSGDLTFYSETMLAIAQARGRSINLPASVRGQSQPGEIGSLVAGESAGCYTLLFRFPLSAKPTFTTGAGGPMPTGYRCVKARLDPDSFDTGSSTPKRHHVSWTCLRYFDVTTSNLYGVGRFIWYDHDLSSVAGLPFVR